MPAKRLGLADHGCLRNGCVADIAVFDAAKVRDVGTFEDPHHYAEGIPYVIVNGIRWWTVVDLCRRGRARSASGSAVGRSRWTRLGRERPASPRNSLTTRKQHTEKLLLISSAFNGPLKFTDRP
jgi:N-acyl-D-aspartate/D-glutamate deacylase